MFFCEIVLGIRLWSRQIEICEAVAKHARVAVKSGHKIGKSVTAAILALWYSICHPGSRVVLTSSSSRQIKDILWYELKRICAGAIVPLGSKDFEPSPPAIGADPFDDPGTGLRLPNGSEVIGFSTDKPERMAGFSGEHLLFLVDEASGVSESIFEALEGNRAGGARIVLFSNPTQTSGTFFDAFNSKRQFWMCMSVSSEETPNCTGQGDPISGLATRAWVDEKKEEWGEDNPLYQVRVKGNFPSQADSSVMSIRLVEDAIRRYATTEGIGPLEAGLDPARFGSDDSRLTIRRGNKAYPSICWNGLDSIQMCPLVVSALAGQRRREEKVTIRVDVIGIGAAVYDTLRAMKIEWLIVVSVNVAERAKAPGYFRLRDQLWFGLRDWLKDGSIPNDAKLEVELLAPKFTFEASGAQRVSSKDEIKAKIKRSPDRADSLALAVCSVESAQVISTKMSDFISRVMSSRQKHQKSTV